MKFLLDAQLPPSLKELFIENGYDCIHTLDLELGNNTPDRVINQLSVTDKRIVITKDNDFFDSFIVKNEPYKLILVKLGNTSKAELLQIFRNRLDEIIEQIRKESMVVLKR
jgi:predicted nuclease of predicted toxin-antitoxin system